MKPVPPLQPGFLPHKLIGGLLALGSMLYPGAATHAAPSPVYTITSPPPWVEVTPVAFPEKAPLDEIVDGVHRILLDRQCDPATKSVYRHEVSQIVTEAGIQSGGDLRLSFDPSYEKVSLHRLRVRRQGAWENRMENTPIRVIQREEELDYHLLDGRLMLMVHLEDIRVGDVVEWSWTITGHNPIMRDQFFDSFNVTGTHPVYDLRLRLRVPDDRKIHYKLHHGAPAPARSKYPNGEIWQWSWKNTPAWQEEKALPSWYEDQPWIDFSEQATWSETVAWALPLYAVQNDSTPALSNLINFCRQAETPEKQILRALRFVQDEIRYLGIEMGAGSHRPNTPATVLKRRFGDCKDKSLLLVTVLRSLGLRAWPALVNTESRQSIEHWLPSPYNFDHVVVALEWEGRLLFIDPTRSQQRGPLAQIYIEDYARALLIRPGETGLVGLHPRKESLPAVSIVEYFQCPSPGRESTYQIHTVHQGAAAEQARTELAESSLQNLQKQYLEYYAHAHPLIRLAAPLVWKDDPETNTLETIESYYVEGLWKSRSNGSWLAEFYPQYIRDVLEKPNQVARRGPFAINHPTHVSHETRIKLWQPWHLQNQSSSIPSSAFVYEQETGSTDNRQTVVFRDRYRTQRDHVLPAEMAAYAKATSQVLDHLGHSLEFHGPSSTASTTSRMADYQAILLTLCLFLALLGSAGWALAVFIHRNRGHPPPLPGATRSFPSSYYSIVLLGLLVLLAAALLTHLGIHPVWSDRDATPAAWGDWMRLLLTLMAVAPLGALLLPSCRPSPSTRTLQRILSGVGLLAATATLPQALSGPPWPLALLGWQIFLLLALVLMAPRSPQSPRVDPINPTQDPPTGGQTAGRPG